MWRSTVRAALTSAKRWNQTTTPINLSSSSTTEVTANRSGWQYYSSKATKTSLTKAKKGNDKKLKSKGSDSSAAPGAAGDDFDSAADDYEAARAQRLAEDEKNPTLDVGPNNRLLFTSTPSLSLLSRKDTCSYLKFSEEGLNAVLPEGLPAGMEEEFKESMRPALLVRQNFLDLRDNFRRIVDPPMWSNYSKALKVRKQIVLDGPVKSGKSIALARRPEIDFGRGGEGSGSSGDGSSSDDEFVSLGSSTSEFTNPYGRHSASQVDSDSSSDTLTQFGTARDYPEQNDLYWYDEKDEDYIMTPVFGEPDFFLCPSEDKFIMTSGTEKEFENPPALYDQDEGLQRDTGIDYLDKPCLFNMVNVNDDSEIDVKNYYHVDRDNQLEVGMKGKPDCNVYSCSTSLCKCCAGRGGFYGTDSVDYSYISSKETGFNHFEFKPAGVIASGYDIDPEHCTHKISNHSVKRVSGNNCSEGSKSASDLHFKVSENEIKRNGFDAHENGDGDANGELYEPETAGDEEGNTADDLLMYNTNEDEYEVFNLRIIHRKNRTGFEESKDLPIVLNTVIAGRYYITEYLGSAAFSKVVQAHDLHTGMDVCLKIIKNDKDFFDQSLDEIKLLKFVNKHDPGDERHILRLYDYFYHQEHLFIVCELLRANLYEFQKFNEESGGETYFTLNRLQVIARQCLEALDYLHNLGIIHCDLKPENILIKSYRRSEIKIIDLGSSCFRTDNLCLYVQSRSYRAPEVILGLPYDEKIDLWSLGCILAELCSGEVLFPNDAVVMILARVIGMLGPIDMEMLINGQETYKYFTKEYDLYYVKEETDQLEYIIPEKSSLEHHLQVSDAGFIDFVRNLLQINPERRPTAGEALQHPWLSSSY